MYSKNDILIALTQMSRIMREVRALDNETKRLISVNAGCSQSDVDECEGNLDQVIEHITDNMCDLDSIPALDIDANFDIIDNALEHVDRASERHQSILLKTVISNSDVYDDNIEGLNELLQECDKPWLVIHTNEVDTLRNALPDGLKNLFDSVKSHS